MTIALGDKARDTISGFAGIVTGRFEYLNGCIRMQIEPDKLDKDGKPIDPRIFDVEQLELVTAAKVRSVRPGGGPHDTPSRQSAPTR